MDPLRHLRIVFGPSVLFFSLLVGAWSNGTLTMCYIEGLKGETIAAIVAIAAAATLPAGFAIGGLTTLLLNALWLCAKNHYQASIDDEAAWDNIFHSLPTVPRPDLAKDTRSEIRLRRLFAAATFVRIRMDREIHGLLDRRYQAFNAYANACVAVSLSWIVGFVIEMQMSRWVLITAPLALLFVVAAIFTWWEMMKLLKYAAQTTDEKDRFPHSVSSPSTRKQRVHRATAKSD